MKQKITIVIPAYQEGEVIASVIRELRKYGYTDIIVVDDGSPDNTYRQAITHGALGIRHSTNRGKGAAVKTGIAAAKLLRADIIVTFDGDGQHHPKDIHTMIDYINNGYDVILGNRFLAKQKIPLVKMIYNSIANTIPFLLYGIWVTDSQSGFRAYSKNAFEALNTESDRYEFDTEVLREIHAHRLTYKEIPICVRYTRYSQEKDIKQNLWTGILTAFQLLRKA